LKFRLPDLRIGDKFYDASLELKTDKKPQIQDFIKFGNPSSVTIVRPTDVGGAYIISKGAAQ
jgi:hypothetical protein